MLQLLNFTSVRWKSQESCSHLKGNPGYPPPCPPPTDPPQNQLQLKAPPGTADTHKDYPASPPDKRFKGGPPWNTQSSSRVQALPLSCPPSTFLESISPLRLFLAFNSTQPELPIVLTTGTVHRWKLCGFRWVRGKLVLSKWTEDVG